MNIKKLANMFGIDQAEENKQLHSDFENLARAHAVLQDANTILAHDLIAKEDELEKIKTDYEQYIEMEVERRILEWAVPENIQHRAFAEGRMSAYSELGIWNIEAHERGNCLVRLSNDPDAEIVELIADDLVDVKPDDDNMTTPDLDSIIIDDLVDIGA